ncbi:recombinase RecT [Streptomyces sp. NPDC056049]|uniref:recombinase RecT n=1 Tax=Streptomyces sp. NPDC056049 TaxID=3345693 RepID=UPI0035E0A88C
MTAELAILQPGALAAQMDYAKAMAASDLLPRQYQGKPANLLWAVSYGQTLGIAPLTAVQSIHVINGKPTASADLIAGLVRRAGHKLRVNGDDKRAVAQIIRADDPDFTFEVVWTIERAQQAKLTGKDTWKNFPAAMLKARAITEVARAACSEILQGTIYTPEELGANVDANGVPIDAPVQQLRPVSQGEQDPWTTAPVREFLREALDAPDAATVRQIWQDAKAHGSRPEYLEQIADVGRKKASAPSPAPEPEVVDGVVVEDVELPTDEHAAAVAALRAFADEHGIDDIDRDAHAALGAPLDAVSEKAIWGLLSALTDGANADARAAS